MEEGQWEEASKHVLLGAGSEAAARSGAAQALGMLLRAAKERETLSHRDAAAAARAAQSEAEDDLRRRALEAQRQCREAACELREAMERVAAMEEEQRAQEQAVSRAAYEALFCLC